MSADNGVYIARFISPKGKYEWRVAECQAIENCDYDGDDADDRKLVQAARVLYFGNKKPFDNYDDAMKDAARIFSEIIKDEFCPICEYGISLKDYDEPLNMTYDEAQKFTDDYWNRENERKENERKNGN